MPSQAGCAEQARASQSEQAVFAPYAASPRAIEDLVVSESRVDGGPIMKRIMPRARGTAYPIKRRCAHIHVALWDGEEPAAE